MGLIVPLLKTVGFIGETFPPGLARKESNWARSISYVGFVGTIEIEGAKAFEKVGAVGVVFPTFGRENNPWGSKGSSSIVNEWSYVVMPNDKILKKKRSSVEGGYTKEDSRIREEKRGSFSL